MSEAERFPTQYRYTRDGEFVTYTADELIDQLLVAVDGVTWMPPSKAPEPWPRCGQLGLPWPGVDKPFPMEPRTLAVVRNAIDLWGNDPFRKRLLADIVMGAIVLGMWAENAPAAKGQAQKILADWARSAADERHKGNRDMKQEALAWYAEHRHEFASKDEAAEAIADGAVVNATFSTVRKWLREPKERT